MFSDVNVSEIADALGFSNVHNFSRAFKSAMGVSPRAYKKGAAPQKGKG
jgi:AraC-like DNA-binding protein